MLNISREKGWCEFWMPVVRFVLCFLFLYLRPHVLTGICFNIHNDENLSINLPISEVFYCVDAVGVFFLLWGCFKFNNVCVWLWWRLFSKILTQFCEVHHIHAGPCSLTHWLVFFVCKGTETMTPCSSKCPSALMSSDPQISEAIRMLLSLVAGGFLYVCTKGQNLAGKKPNKSKTKKKTSILQILLLLPGLCYKIRAKTTKQLKLKELN